jgi:hypothetical protein|nr:MAG TPA_asm: hypothetical protein [Caudoviricetes sp.]
MIQKIVKDITSDKMSPFLERINDHNFNNVFEENSSLYLGYVKEPFLVYRYPSLDNFPRYSIQKPDTIYQDTWYSEGDKIAVCFLKNSYTFDSSKLISIQEALLKNWKSAEETEFYIKSFKSDTFMNLPLSKIRWSLFCWCNGDLLVISLEPESGVITLDCANSGREWNGDTEGAFNLIISILENILNIE